MARTRWAGIPRRAAVAAAAVALCVPTGAAAAPAALAGASLAPSAGDVGLEISEGYTMRQLVGPNPLMKSTGMIVYHDEDEHFLYSADTLRNTIFRVDLDTFAVDRIAHDFEPAGELLISPHTLEIDDAGRLYVTEWAPQAVRRLNRDGSGRAVIGAFTGKDAPEGTPGAPTGTTGIAFDPSRTRLFVGDSVHDRDREGGLWEVDPLGVRPPEQIIRERWMVEEISIVPDRGSGALLAYVADVYGGAIRVVDVDAADGQRHLAHRDLTGFDKPWGIEYDAARDRLLVLEMGGSLWAVDLATGARSRLARIDRPGMTSIAIDPGDDANHPGDDTIYVSNGVYGGVYRLDETRGTLLPVLPEGSFAVPTSLNPLPADSTLPPGTLWVGDFTSIATLNRTGKVDRLLNFQADDYEPPNGDDPHWLTPSALQTDKTTVYFGETGFAPDGITRLDLRTGAREVITEPGDVSIPYHLRSGPDDDLLVTDAALDPVAGLPRAGRLLRVDSTSGTVTVLVDDLDTAGGLRYDPGSGLAYVSEVAPTAMDAAPAGRIWAVDVVTGERTLVADGLHTPEGLDLDGEGGLVVVEGDGLRRLVRVDLATGEQEVIAAGLPTKLRGPFPFPLAVDLLADVVVRGNGEIVVTAPEDASVLTFRPTS